ncbi:MAG TPA: energy-coupling factor transporter transmembrane protein EcfT [Candidatus Caccocola faecipullorum]|nr:energy-coupling factor transporter transmembrane protein EcfT [Candidatus Caccocola faecipullorum]
MASLDKIPLGQYIPADSFVHSLDPRVKIIVTIIAMIAIFMLHTAPAFALCGLFIFLLSRLARLPFRLVAASSRPVLILVIFTALFHLFLTPGKALFSFFGIEATAEGALLGLAMALRLIYLVMFASLLTFTTTPAKISDGLEGLLSPLKRLGLPAHDIAMMITIALRFIPTLFEETSRIIKAQKSRGADFESGGLMRRARAYVPVLIPLFVIVFKRAENLAVAMEARGYAGGEGRTRMRPLRWRRSDGAALAGFIFLSALLVVFDRAAGRLL